MLENIIFFRKNPMGIYFLGGFFILFCHYSVEQ
jgi:hypothetical protein